MDYGKEETRSYVHTWETLYEGDAEDLEESSYVYKSAEQLRTASFTGTVGNLMTINTIRVVYNTE